jgi:hypothetical protein
MAGRKYTAAHTFPLFRYSFGNKTYKYTDDDCTVICKHSHTHTHVYSTQHKPPSPTGGLNTLLCISDTGWRFSFEASSQHFFSERPKSAGPEQERRSCKRILFRLLHLLLAFRIFLLGDNTDSFINIHTHATQWCPFDIALWFRISFGRGK